MCLIIDVLTAGEVEVAVLDVEGEELEVHCAGDGQRDTDTVNALPST